MNGKTSKVSVREVPRYSRHWECPTRQWPDGRDAHCSVDAFTGQWTRPLAPKTAVTLLELVTSQPATRAPDSPACTGGIAHLIRWVLQDQWVIPHWSRGGRLDWPELLIQLLVYAEHGLQQPNIWTGDLFTWGTQVGSISRLLGHKTEIIATQLLQHNFPDTTTIYKRLEHGLPQTWSSQEFLYYWRKISGTTRQWLRWMMPIK